MGKSSWKTNSKTTSGQTLNRPCRSSLKVNNRGTKKTQETLTGLEQLRSLGVVARLLNSTDFVLYLLMDVGPSVLSSARMGLHR